MADRSSVSWLGGKVLIATVAGELAEGPVAMELSRNGEKTTMEGHAFPIPASSRQDGAPGDESLLISSIATDVTELDGWSLSARTSRSELELPLSDPEVATDPKTLVRQFLAPLDAETRNRAIDFLARTAGGEERDPRTSEALLGIREALRERLPLQENRPENRRGLAAEQVLRVDDRSFYLKGWMHDQEAEIVRLTAVSPEGARVELWEKLFREARSDVVDWSTEFGPEEKGGEYGFICFVEFEAPSLLRGPWMLEMENADGTEVEVVAPAVQEEILPTRAMILHDCATRRVLEDDLMVDHIMPAITRIQKVTASKFEIDTVVQHGDPPPAPDVSIIVPIYMNTEYLEGQLAEFAGDPAISQSDLIFVLDSPEQASWLDYWAGELYPIYRVPFRIVTLEHNVGYAVANNAGASEARGRLLLLLNSDVLPDKPGWLEAMRDFYDSKPTIGALAPKLLYEDDSIQHAGMYFQKRQAGQDVVDSHYFRGLHRSFPAANVARTVPAVTGACMMIARDLYEEFDGLSYQYVQGDYEDFDLCLRLSQAGRENWYIPEAELYHLEAQSYEPALRGPANRYNQWLNGHIWKEQLEALTEQSRSESSLNAAGETEQGAT